MLTGEICLFKISKLQGKKKITESKTKQQNTAVASNYMESYMTVSLYFLSVNKNIVGTQIREGYDVN